MGRAVGPGGRRRVSGRLPPGCSAAGTDRRSGRRCHPASGLPRPESRCPRATRSATRDCDRTDTRWQPAPVAGRHPWRSADAPGTQGAGVARPGLAQVHHQGLPGAQVVLEDASRGPQVVDWHIQVAVAVQVGQAHAAAPMAKPVERRKARRPINCSAIRNSSKIHYSVGFTRLCDSGSRR